MHIAAHHPLTNSQPGPRASGAFFAGVVGWLGNLARRWQERAAERRELALMDDRALRDARLTRWDVQQELSRPFWRG